MRNGRCASPRSERSWQTEYVLGDIRKNEVGRDRRDLIQPGLAELALDVVFAGKAVATVGLQADIGRLERDLAARCLAMFASAPQG